MSNEQPIRIMTSLRIDYRTHCRLRKIAFQRDVSLHSLLIEGAKAVADKYELADGHRSSLMVQEHPL